MGKSRFVYQISQSFMPCRFVTNCSMKRVLKLEYMFCNTVLFAGLEVCSGTAITVLIKIKQIVWTFRWLVWISNTESLFYLTIIGYHFLSARLSDEFKLLCVSPPVQPHLLRQTQLRFSQRRVPKFYRKLSPVPPSGFLSVALCCDSICPRSNKVGVRGHPSSRQMWCF